MKKVAEFDIRDLVPVTILIGIAGIAAVLMLQMQESTKLDILSCENATFVVNVSNTAQCYDPTNSSITGNSIGTDSEAWTAAGDAVEGTAKIPAQLPMIAGVVVIAILIGILVRYLLGRF